MRFRSIVLLCLIPAAYAVQCNICGPGTTNYMADPQGVVTITVDNIPRKQNCQKWQNSLLISEEWCIANILKYTPMKCKCTAKGGTLLVDLTAPTVSPAPSAQGWKPSFAGQDPPAYRPVVPPGASIVEKPSPVETTFPTFAEGDSPKGSDEEQNSTDWKDDLEDGWDKLEDNVSDEQVIIAIVVVGVVLALVTCCCIVVCLRRRQQNNDTTVVVVVEGDQAQGEGREPQEETRETESRDWVTISK